MPKGAIYVGRASPFGNPFPIEGDFIVWATVARGRYNNLENRRLTATELYRAWLTGERLSAPPPARKDDLIVFESGAKRSTDEHARGIAIWAARALSRDLKLGPPPTKEQIAALKDRDLACFCPLDQICHADVLLELANAPSAPR
jgi:hypothetical protein